LCDGNAGRGLPLIMIAAAEIAERIGARPRSDSEWFDGCCPNRARHRREDTRPSLSFSDGDQGVIFKCHAGCVSKDVAHAMAQQLHCRVADFFFTSPGQGRGGRVPVATYAYRDERGELLYQVVRYDVPKKDFRQRRPDGRGGWIWNLQGPPRPVPAPGTPGGDVAAPGRPARRLRRRRREGRRRAPRARRRHPRHDQCQRRGQVAGRVYGATRQGWSPRRHHLRRPRRGRRSPRPPGGARLPHGRPACQDRAVSRLARHGGYFRLARRRPLAR
jgi:hypothetical protein